MDNGLKLLSAQRAFYRLAQDVPNTPRLVVYEVFAVKPEGKVLAVESALEYPGSSHVSGVFDRSFIKSRKSS